MSNRTLAGRITGRDQFLPALRAAADRAPASWRGDPDAHVWARVPASWTRYKIHGRTVSGGRDIALPAARYWPGGSLPIGPDYAARVTLAPDELHRRAAARCERERDDALCFAGIACANKMARERWIDTAHAAERAMFANLALADKAAAPIAPEPVPAAPAPVLPAAPAPVAVPVPARPRKPVQTPRKAPVDVPVNPILLTWWHDAIASWSAYQSPADHDAIARFEVAIRALSDAMPDYCLREHMVRAVKAGRAFPARWFVPMRQAA